MPAYRLNITTDYSQLLRNCSLRRIIVIMCKSAGYFLLIHWHFQGASGHVVGFYSTAGSLLSAVYVNVTIYVEIL
jgi:hypothetical protein